MRYGAILADPPWKLSGGKNGKGGWSKTASPDAHYPLLKTEEIMALDVPGLAEPNGHLWLWVPNCLLPDGLEVMAAWGYRYLNNVVWGKTTGLGLGQYLRTQHELLLFGTRGRVPYARNAIGRRVQPRTLVLAPRGRHSAKPPEIRSLIELVSPAPRIELFARERVPGWDSWGNEVECSIKLAT